MKYILTRLLYLFLILTIPFLALIRGAVFFHNQYNLGAWISILFGVFATFLVIAVYRILAYGPYIFSKDKSISFSSFWKLSLIIILAYCIHAVFFLSSKNIKSNQVRSEIFDLHPIVRLSVSTIVLIDEDLIITDASRVPEDYRRMGLPTKNASLHYKQKDGYAYALDIRTNGRFMLRNWLIKGYFSIMGFNTLRHVGTDDHLHISLPCHYAKGSI